jgi:GDP-4-dehydro-6-deoxy-D-mannose reductase
VRTLLVTGHTGFVGRAVRDALQAPPAASEWRFATLPETLDIRSPELAAHIDAIRPAAVMHLAGRTNVAESFREPEDFFDVNVHGTWNLLKSLRSSGFDGRLLFVSSGDCYGAIPPASLPIGESQPLRPRNPYAVSKAAAEALCYQWSQTERIGVILSRSFNHVGPGQDARFAIASFARQVARIRAGKAPPRIETGSLDVTRDVTDVRDVVRAYLALLERGRPGEIYNVGSGVETRLADVLDALLEYAGVAVERVIDPGRLRADEQRRAVADVRKIAADTGWTASIPLAKTLHDVLDDWNERTRFE